MSFLQTPLAETLLRPCAESGSTDIALQSEKSSRISAEDIALLVVGEKRGGGSVDG